jgi:putative ABC transport system substrate-binding protein
MSAYRRGLSDAGYVEGKNVLIEYRWASGHNDRLPGMAADLVRRQVRVIFASSGTPPVLAAKAATTTIPIVFAFGNDPVRLGLVASLNRPGGNLTGVTALSIEVAAKRLELLHEIVPSASVIAVLVNPTNPNAEGFSDDLQRAAHALGLQIHVLHASAEPDFTAAFEALAEFRAGALIIGNDPLFDTESRRLGAMALRYAVPTMTAYRELAVDGGLVCYGILDTDLFHLAGDYTGRIIAGAKPADLPVQQTTKVGLLINLRTAKALGLTVPLTIQAAADEVIE